MPPAYLAAPQTRPTGTTQPCFGKHPFASPTVAQDVARDMMAATLAKRRDKRHVRAYRCRDCNAWHVTGGMA